MKICNLCTRPHYAKNLCKMHYKRSLRHADPSIALTSGGRPRVEACTICGAPVHARGWCLKHWKRWRKYGDPTRTVIALRGEHQAFLEKAISYTGDECLIWPYGTYQWGYGAIEGGSAHVYVCTATHGPAPAERPEAAHYCGKPACVTPRHLRWATHAENMADMIKHGTSRKSL